MQTITTAIGQLIEKASTVFVDQFATQPTLAASAPGRVNLIGEHTDYNDGFVMPLALEKVTVIVAKPNGSSESRVIAMDMQNEVVAFPVDGTMTPGEPFWANYVKGVVAQFIKNGHAVPAFDAVITSNVPIGAGLSSSAALEVATATICEQLTGITLDKIDKALWCQQAEHDYANMPCGIMDQFISSLGEAGHALLIDCRSHETRLTKLDDPAVSILVTNSNVEHELTGSEYPTRRKQCETASQILGVKALRDADMAMLDAVKDKMEPIVYKRAHHVISENQRTAEAADALDSGDYEKVGQLMYASHDSLKNDFQVSCKELDALVDMASNITGVFGSRMTGGGFGGCSVSLVETSKLVDVINLLSAGYQEKTGKQCTCFVTKAGDGARVIEL